LKLCFLLVGRRMKKDKKKKENRSSWGLFSRAGTGHTLLAGLGRIFVTVKSN
jgi:hypothetical protein